MLTTKILGKGNHQVLYRTNPSYILHVGHHTGRIRCYRSHCLYFQQHDVYRY